MKTNALVPTLFLLSLLAHAAVDKLPTEALAMVPKGRVMAQSFREVTVKTQSGTKVKVEFDRKGPLQEASGLNLNRGDEFEPGSGLVSLSTAAQAAAKAGHRVRGEWKLEKDEQYGWVYELAGEEGEQKTYYLVAARSGKLLTSIAVPLPAAAADQASGPPDRSGVRR